MRKKKKSIFSFSQKKANRKPKAKKIKKTKTKIKNPTFNLSNDAKGLFFLSLSALLTLCLISFSQDHPVSNFLGSVGFSASWLLFALFGIGSYLIIPFLAFLGWQAFSEDKNLKKKKTRQKTPPCTFSALQNSLYFIIFLASISLILTVLAENFSFHASIFENQVFIEKINISPLPYHFQTRYYLGGIPAYYLYSELPFINLQNLFSSTGTLFLTATAAFASFLLLTGFKVLTVIKKLPALIKTLVLKVKNLFPKTEKNLSFNEVKEKFLKKGFLELEKEKKTLISLSLKKDPTSKVDKEKQPAPSQDPSASITATTSDEASGSKAAKSANAVNITTSQAAIKDKAKNLSSGYVLPSLNMLTDPPKADMPSIKKELEQQAQILEETLKSFGIEGKVNQINCGPTITSFEVQPAIGVKVQKIKALENDIALNLQAKSIRIIAPIPGKAAVGVEIPSLHPQPVTLKEILAHYQTQKKKASIPLLLGKTVAGEYVATDLTKMPHLLIAGATGSGKSVCINTIVISILMNISPDKVKLLMVDPKKVELTQYSELPHMIAPVITEAHGAYAALQWLVREMHHRYEMFKQTGCRNITSFNHRKIDREKEASLTFEVPEKLPLMVAIIDEFADLMMVSSSDLETPIARIAQMARAVGIHLILATQRPSREVITGIIKANFPTRIAFKVASRINSQIILDENGAESLLGNGDLLFSPPGTSSLVRAQGAFISDKDINEIVSSICKKAPPSYLIPSFDSLPKADSSFAFEKTEEKDALYDQAVTIVLQYKNASTTFLQRKLKIGYARAASLIDALEENGVVGPSEGSKPRRILIKGEQDLIGDEN